MTVGRRLAVGLLLLRLVTRLSAQDTAQVYPWRLSYFPYVTASPNDGVMAMARAVWFRQSRWDDRVSVHDQVAVEGGYSTRGSWLLRATADFPRLRGGGRFQLVGQAGREEHFVLDAGPAVRAARQSGAAEFSIPLADHWYGAFRTTGTHLSVTDRSEFALTERVALVLDLRDREYDTQRGALLQVGGMVGYASSPTVDVGTSHGFSGWYGLGAGWLTLGERTRLSGRGGIRRWSQSATPSVEALRTFPAWEDAFTVLGGARSNRALPIAEYPAREVALLSAEIRQELMAFPGGAISVLAFVDAGKATDPADIITVTLRTAASLRASTDISPGWVVGAGGGVALRLLRNAVLTATVARAEQATRLYISSGWSW